MLRIRDRAVLVLAFLFMADAACRGAGMNCAEAQSFREKTVCATPALYAMDSRFTAAYDADRAALSPAGAALLQSDQRDWLHWIDADCPPSYAGDGGPVACLTTEYQERLDELKSSVQRIGGWTFFTRTHYVYASGTPNADDRDPGYGDGKFAWPQIDSPTPAQQAFNRAVYRATVQLANANDIKHPSLDTAVDASGTIDAGFSIAAANSRLVEVDFSDSTFSWGAAHPNTALATFAWWIDSGRALQPDDVFRSGSGWRAALLPLVIAKLRKDPGPDALWTGKELLDGVKDGDSSSQFWDICRSGLTITFNSYQVGPYSSGAPSVTFQWPELAKYLAPALQPATLPACRVPR
jgi:uncharacterized protein